MSATKNYLNYYYNKYPESEIVDYFILIYQATFGTGIMVDKPATSLAKLKDEILKTNEVDFYENLYDFISYDYVRVNLRVYRKYNLNINLLNENYLHTASMFVDNNKIFNEEVTTLKNFLIEKGFNISDINNHFLNLLKDKYSLPSHSSTYHQAYRPSYRIIHQKYISEELRYYQLRHFIDQYPKTQINLFAIEGKVASGKTVLASLIKKDTDITIINVNDFKDKNEGEIPINSFRLIKDVFKQVILNQSLKYNKYNHLTKKYETQTINKVKPNIIIEGLYSLNPILEDYYTGNIYIHINEEIRQLRLRQRNKPILSNPKEDIYFDKYKIINKADIII